MQNVIAAEVKKQSYKPYIELVDKSNQSPISGLLEILFNNFHSGDLTGNNPDRLLLAASSRKLFDQIGDENVTPVSRTLLGKMTKLSL